MARIRYVQIGDAKTGDLASLRREILELRGRILNLHRVLANNTSALQAFMTMSRYVRDASSLPASLRELAILSVGHALKNEYEISQHSPIARNAGITDVQLDELPDWRISHEFSTAERAVVAFAWAATAERRVTDAVFEELASHFSPAQVVDLAVLVGWYHLCNVVINSLGVELEAPEP